MLGDKHVVGMMFVGDGAQGCAYWASAQSLALALLPVYVEAMEYLPHSHECPIFLIPPHPPVFPPRLPSIHFISLPWAIPSQAF